MRHAERREASSWGERRSFASLRMTLYGIGGLQTRRILPPLNRLCHLIDNSVPHADALHGRTNRTRHGHGCMDLGTLGGLIGGFVLLLVALVMAASHGGSNVSLGQFVDPPAAILVLGGGLCVVMISVPLRVFLGLPKVIAKLCFNKTADNRELIGTLVKLAEIARKEGLLALENKVDDQMNPTLLIGLRMAVDGTRPELIEHVIKKEIAHIEATAHTERRMFDMMGRCGPAF